MATTNPGGAGKWRCEFAEDFLAGATRVVWADCDRLGRSHADEVAQELARVGFRTHASYLDTDRDDGYDIADYLDELRDGDATGEELTAHVQCMTETAQAREPVTYTGHLGNGLVPDGPFALGLDEFLAEKTDTGPALIGNGDDVVLPADGFDAARLAGGSRAGGSCPGGT